MGYMVKSRALKSGDTAVVLPVGDTPNRPADPVIGATRINTDLGSGLLEFYNGTEFKAMSVQGTVQIVVDTYTGDGSTVEFGPLSVTAPSAANVLVFMGQLYQIPTVSYSISITNTIVFVEAPPPGVTVAIVHNVGSTVTA